MTFIEKDNCITINGIFTCSTEIFKILEPTYQSVPSGYNQRIYIPGKQHTITSDSGFQTINENPIWEDGDRYISRLEEFILLKQHILRDEIETQSLIETELLKRIPYNEKRKCEYPSTDLLVIALWKHIVEMKNETDSGITELQEKRNKVKQRYPRG